MERCCPRPLLPLEGDVQRDEKREGKATQEPAAPPLSSSSTEPLGCSTLL